MLCSSGQCTMREFDKFFPLFKIQIFEKSLKKGLGNSKVLTLCSIYEEYQGLISKLKSVEKF